MKRAYIYLHLAVLLAGFTGIFGKLIELNQVVLVFYRTLLASIMLGVFLLFSRKKSSYKTKDILHIAGAGAVITLHWIFFYGSIKESNVSIGVVCFCLTGFFTSILSPLMGRKKFDKYELLLSLLVLLGIVLIFSFDTTYRFGILLGVISAFLASLFTILNERLIKSYDVWCVNFYQMVTATIVSVLLMLIYKAMVPSLSIVPAKMDWIYLIIFALFCTVLMYAFMLMAQRKVSAFTVNLSFNLEPIYSIILAIALFHENKVLKPSFYIGCGMIVLSIVIQMWRLAQKRRKVESYKF
ncbi:MULTISPECIES: DMT family transporter [Chitinophagaceae]